MNTKTLTTQRRLQIAILGYGLLFRFLCSSGVHADNPTRSSSNGLPL